VSTNNEKLPTGRNILCFVPKPRLGVFILEPIPASCGRYIQEPAITLQTFKSSRSLFTLANATRCSNFLANIYIHKQQTLTIKWPTVATLSHFSLYALFYHECFPNIVLKIWNTHNILHNGQSHTTTSLCLNALQPTMTDTRCLQHRLGVLADTMSWHKGHCLCRYSSVWCPTIQF
jgi:hypothetical protein